MTTDDSFDAPRTTARLTRRRLLALAGGAAGMGLLTVNGVAYAEAPGTRRQQALAAAVEAVQAPRFAPPAAVRGAPLAGFQKATQSGFSPINSSLTFGAPTDLAAGWDGTVWAIDAHGAPHLYDPLGDTWQLHGTGIDAASASTAFQPAVLFKGSEVFIADGQHAVQPISSRWPNLPPSYQLGVDGAAAGVYRLVLFRGGTFLTVPLPPTTAFAAGGDDDRVYHTVLQAAQAATPSPTPNWTPSPTRSPTTGAVPTVTPSPTPAVTATSAPSHTPTPSPTSVATPSATATLSPTPTSAATQTPVPTSTSTPTPTPVPTPAAPAAAPSDYVAVPLNTIKGWPQTANWQSGLTDGVYSYGSEAVCVRGSEAVIVQLDTVSLADSQAIGPYQTGHAGPMGLSGLPADWLATGFGASFDIGDAQLSVFTKGAQAFVVPWSGAESAVYHAPFMQAAPATLTVTPHPSASATPTATRAATPSVTPSATGTATPTATATGRPSVGAQLPPAGLNYIARVFDNWPASWHPQLQHAPSGRSDGLWAATQQGQIVSFDGTRWTEQPGDALSVAAGRDGAVFAVGKQNPQQLSQWTGSAWNPVATHSSALNQVAVGNQNLVWTRDSSNAVHQLTNGQLQAAPVVGSAVHLAANHDGTLWSCTGQDPHANRYASDLGVAPAAVPANGTVQKVASSGFGTAHCLTSQSGTPQLYQYDSPYVFRTPGNYIFPRNNPIEQGLGSIFFVAQSHGYFTGAPEPSYQVVALDAHTGVELSRSAAAPPNLLYTAPTFDALHETLIVGLTTDSYVTSTRQPGQLIGLDARDLSQVRWSLTLHDNLPLGPGRPTLVGTRLCVSDNFNNLVTYDTGAAATASTPTYIWTYNFPTASQDSHILPPPVLANGSVYAAWWLFSTTYGFLQLWLAKIDPATGQGSHRVVQPAGANVPYVWENDPRQSAAWNYSMAQNPPLLGITSATPGQSHQVLFVNGGVSVWGVDLDTVMAQSYSSQNYSLPGSTFVGAGAGGIASGFGFANGVLWFGDDSSNLHGIDSLQLKAVPNTPASFGGAGAIGTTPILYTDAQGESAVLFGVTAAAQLALNVFDPSSGITIAVPTASTPLIGLSRTVSNGVVYAGGGTGDSPGDPPRAQVFAIRVDEAVQELRDFVVDSQLMQDFDDPSQPTHNPNGQARYQTHLTLVGNQNAPLPNEPVKIWADQTTNILVNGQTVSIGPDDDSFAAFKTGSDGSLVIMSGYTQADGSDKTDMSASPLRVWAGFMDPYERMLIQPDREHHNRVAAAHATNPGQAGADDPTKINLQTTQTYGDLKNQGKTPSSNTQFFTAQQKADNQPQQVANAIQTMTSAVGTAPPAGSKTLKASFALHATDIAGKYIAGADMPGAQYSPNNVASNRAAVVLQPVGLTYSSNNTASIPPAYSSMTPVQAMQAIDALEGQPWATSQYATPRVKAAADAGTLHRLGDFWDDLWGWLKQAAATVTHVIVAVANDIYAGIRFIVNGVAHVFQAIVAGIEQVANTIASFFVELGHLIEEIIEALSVLFQFGHIIDTHNILKAELLKRINGDGSVTYPGLVALVGSPATGSTPATGAIAKVDAFFEQGEQAISQAFSSMANALSGTSSSSLAGGGSTVHDAFTATPRGGGASSSNSTQATWGFQKLQAGVGGGGGSLSMALAHAGRLQGADDPTTLISTIFTDFANRMSTDPVLSQQWTKVKQGAQQMSNASSAADFVKDGLAELLQILALILDGVLAVTNAFVDALLGGIAAIVEVLFGTNGILTTELNIPVLSWLYNLLFGEPLTILNAGLLVVAIPVTILWRVIEGQWVSDSVNAVAASPAALGEAVPTWAAQVLGSTSAIFSLFLGVLNGISDFMTEAVADDPVYNIVSGLELAFNVTGSVATGPFWTEGPADMDWVNWGVGLASGLMAILGAVPALNAAVGTELESYLEMVLSLAEAVAQGVHFHDNPPKDGIGDAAFGLGIAALLPGAINPAKLFGYEATLVVSAVDVIFGVVGCVAGFLSTFDPANT